MKYGCIGEKLGHSYSAQIHAMIGKYEYELCEIPRDALDAFLTKRDFDGINVTIPYKEKVIPYLDGIDEAAKAIGAVNTVVNRGGKLYGYNTDFYGLSSLLSHAGINPAGQKAAILGTGGTAKTAYAVLTALGAKEILRVSREEKPGCITYEQLKKKRADVTLLCNTTPIGMYPNTEESVLDPAQFPNLAGVVDVIYNPLRTKLMSEAQARAVKTVSGLYMLVAQAVRASEIFTGEDAEPGLVDKIYRDLCAARENIVLVGMPGAGKTTVGKILAQKLGRDFIDTDEVIARGGKTPAEIIKEKGEDAFRDTEERAVAELCRESAKIIATGGGAVLRSENIRRMKQNGCTVFLDRPLASIAPTPDRPLTLDRDALLRRYLERIDLYRGCADVTVEVSGTPESVADRIICAYNERKCK